MADKTSFLQQWLEKIWYENGSGRFLLLPLTALYCVVNNYQRNKLSKQQPHIECPIIVVGNITVGGTGKTPLTIYITQLLQKSGFKPAIITRGYGGKSEHWPQYVKPNTDPNLVGDEAVLMATRTNVPIYAGANRLESILKLLAQHDVDVIISDDGLQHYKMPRDIQIAVIDATRLLGNGLCLPAGPLRERKERLDSCDFVVLNGGKPSDEFSHNMQLTGDVLINLSTAEEMPVEGFKEKRVNAVTGIGNPQRFYTSLKEFGLVLETVSFPDHHDFQKEDIDFKNESPIIMTEKDAVKCKTFAKENMWYLPISASLDNNFNQDLLQLLKEKD